MYRELLLGCGHKKEKRINPCTFDVWQNVTTVDFNPACDPDVVADLDAYEWPATWTREPNKGVAYNWTCDTYDEIHAYEVLEHLGSQGDYRQFFNFMYRAWTLLKPHGWFCATTPSRFSPWLWGDPGHRRAILPETLTFLDQSEYTKQIGKTAMSDYRYVWMGDFRIIDSRDDRSTHMFILQAQKPERA